MAKFEVRTIPSGLFEASSLCLLRRLIATTASALIQQRIQETTTMATQRPVLAWARIFEQATSHTRQAVVDMNNITRKNLGLPEIEQEMPAPPATIIEPNEQLAGATAVWKSCVDCGGGIGPGPELCTPIKDGFIRAFNENRLGPPQAQPTSK